MNNYRDIPFSDVTFLVQGKEFHLHKCILSMNCHYFKTMLSSGMTESTSKVIEIRDDHPDAFSQVIDYIYMGRIPQVDEGTISTKRRLMELAHKYMLTGLYNSMFNDIITYYGKLEVFLEDFDYLFSYPPMRDFVMATLIDRWHEIMQNDKVMDIILEDKEFSKDLMRSIYCPKSFSSLQYYLRDQVPKDFFDAGWKIKVKNYCDTEGVILPINLTI